MEYFSAPGLQGPGAFRGSLCPGAVRSLSNSKTRFIDTKKIVNLHKSLGACMSDGWNGEGNVILGSFPVLTTFDTKRSSIMARSDCAWVNFDGLKGHLLAAAIWTVLGKFDALKTLAWGYAENCYPIL